MLSNFGIQAKSRLFVVDLSTSMLAEVTDQATIFGTVAADCESEASAWKQTLSQIATFDRHQRALE